MNVLIAGDPAPDLVETVTAMLERWHGGPVTVITEPLREADFVIALPGGNADDVVARARKALIRVVEVCDGDHEGYSAPQP